MTGKLKERVRIVLFIILLLVILLSIPLARCKPKPKVPSCALRNVPLPVALHITDPKTGEFQNVVVPDWHVLCGDAVPGEKIHGGRYLPLPHPTSWDDASKAASEWLQEHPAKLEKP